MDEITFALLALFVSGWFLGYSSGRRTSWESFMEAKEQVMS